MLTCPETPKPIIRECQAYGVNVRLVDGTIADAGRILDGLTSRGNWVGLSMMKEPYRVEGRKTIVFEIADHIPEIKIGLT